MVFKSKLIYFIPFIIDKGMDVIPRLSSRVVKNTQNQSAMVENCNTMPLLCIEKS
jgi:hypothetical protein